MFVSSPAAMSASERTDRSAPVAKGRPADAAEVEAFDRAMTATSAEGSGAPMDTRFHHQSSRSAELRPLQKFESFVLRSFVESMLPSENTSFFGTGTAGNIWRSMLAEHIGDEMASAGGVGIAKMLEENGRGEIPGSEGPKAT